MADPMSSHQAQRALGRPLEQRKGPRQRNPSRKTPGATHVRPTARATAHTTGNGPHAQPHKKWLPPKNSSSSKKAANTAATASIPSKRAAKGSAAPMPADETPNGRSKRGVAEAHTCSLNTGGMRSTTDTNGPWCRRAGDFSEHPPNTLGRRRARRRKRHLRSRTAPAPSLQAKTPGAAREGLP